VGLSAIAALVAWTSAAAAGSGEIAPRLRARLDPRSDEVVARSYVPSPEQRVGEVRLVRRGDANVVQTLLYTKVLSRVVAEIRRKELANWPEGPGRADALRYVEALSATQSRIFRELPARGPAGDRLQKMWIEFVVAPGAALVAIGRFEMEGRDGEVRIASREPLVVMEPSRDYVLRNMRLIAADSFHVEGEALRALLQPLEWLRAPPPPAAPAADGSPLPPASRRAPLALRSRPARPVGMGWPRSSSPRT
jgi:hypothetical protein